MIKVKVIPVIHLRTITTGPDGKICSWSKKFQKPESAATHWAEELANEWQEKKFAGDGASYHRMTYADYNEKHARIEKAYRRSIPIFKRMVQVD
jgi:hypothetical protein